MTKTRRKIWDLYDLLTEKEIPICQAWVSAHAGGPSTKIARLFRLLRREKTDEKVWKKLYPDENYNDNRLRLLFHELGKYLEDFIAFQQFRKSPFQRDLYLIKGLNRRGMAETFRYFYRKVKQRWERQPIRNSRYYWALYGLEGEFLHHTSKFPSKNKPDYSGGVEKNLEQAILLDLMRNSMINRNESEANRPFSKSSYLEKLEEVGRAFEYEKSSLLGFYKDLHLFLKDQSSNSDLLISKIKRIWELGKESSCEIGDKSEFVNLGNLVLNKLIIKNNQEPSKEVLSQLFDYYVWMIEQELLQLDGVLEPVHYRNVVSNGLLLKYWDQTKAILENFIQKLPKANQEDAFAFGLGRYLFYKGEFTKSRQILNRKFGYYLEDLIARFYMLQGLYELKRNDNLLYQLDLLKAFIVRHKKLSDAGKKRYMAKANYFIRLLKSKEPKDYLELKEEIKNRKDSASPDWLIEKCEEKID